MLRRRRHVVDDRRGCEEDDQVDRDVEEGLVQNVDVEVVEEGREDDPDQVMLMTTAKTMKLAKSRSEVDARHVVVQVEGILLKKMMWKKLSKRW